MRKRKAYLVIELDNDELSILPLHLQGLVQRPLVDPLTTREAPNEPWPGFETEPQRRAKQTRDRLARVRRQQTAAIERGEIDPPEGK